MYRGLSNASITSDGLLNRRPLKKITLGLSVSLSLTHSSLSHFLPFSIRQQSFVLHPSAILVFFSAGTPLISVYFLCRFCTSRSAMASINRMTYLMSISEITPNVFLSGRVSIEYHSMSFACLQVKWQQRPSKSRSSVSTTSW